MFFGGLVYSETMQRRPKLGPVMKILIWLTSSGYDKAIIPFGLLNHVEQVFTALTDWIYVSLLLYDSVTGPSS